MTAETIIAAIDLPPACRVDKPVPKKLFVEHGAPTAADKRRIHEGIEEVTWVASLKPTTVGIPIYRDERREYLEIAVLWVKLRGTKATERLTELVHRAVPYPVLAIVETPEGVLVSGAHLRWSQAEAGVTVLDDAPLVVACSSQTPAAFLEALALGRQPHGDLYGAYQGWLDTLVALRAFELTGCFVPNGGAGQADRQAIAECEALDAQLATLLAAAEKATQMAKRVEINLEIKKIRAQRDAVVARLGKGAV